MEKYTCMKCGTPVQYYHQAFCKECETTVPPTKQWAYYDRMYKIRPMDWDEWQKTND